MYTGVARNEIWVCDIKESYKHVIRGEHPVLIVSNFKHILKADTVNILAITSQNTDDVGKSQVLLDGYGLQKQSKVLCEQILTVNKEDLKYKVGKLDAKKILEVNKKLAQHLQVDNRYKNLESQDIEDLFFDKVNEIAKVKRFNNLKNKIYHLYSNKEYEKSIEVGEILIKESVSSSLENKNDFLWYGYYLLSSNYIKLKNMKKALVNAKESLKYIKEIDIQDEHYSLSMWAIARTSEDVDKIKAIKIYSTLSKLYKEIDYKQMRVGCIFNIARLQNSKRNMSRIVTFVEKIELKNWYFNISKDEYLSGLREEINTM